MNIEKKEVFKKLLPVAVLQAMNAESFEAIPPDRAIDGMISIMRFPFKIGRESRVRQVDGKLERIERLKIDNREPSNDLYLIDRGALLNISREHFLIECGESGFRLVDRGSACGTRINDEPVGGNDAGGILDLEDGDEIVIGTRNSPYRFRFVDLRGFDVCEEGEK